MKKIINFIIDKKYLILTLFIIGAIFCVYLSTKVNINYDIANYLPKSSNVKKGLDIMNDEFDSKTSTFYIMFDDLKEEEKNIVFEDIKKEKNIKSVDYDESEDYNIENHTLYKVTVEGNTDSDIASSAYKNITDKYKDYKIQTSGDVADRNTEVLPKYVLVAAVAFGTVILIIMCDSVVEVFLFLFTILIAVLLNKGTNIMFNSVSNITDSISAILQLALSMDYSIMLMNRFNQAREKEKDITKAMKEALYSSFSSVSSSSVTTVVGLIALVFMSFTIGKDLGFVLAKGVLCSLIATFFVLPGLILIFNKAIDKTKKKVPNVKMDKIAKFSYKFRFVLLPLFIIIFIGSYFLKGNLNIIFLENSRDEISAVFNKENEIAVIYNNKNEEKIAALCDNLNNNDKLTSVLCYSNTINEELKYNEMNNKFNDLGADTNIDDYLLKLIYYKYYTNEDNKIDFNSLIKFIYDVVYKNKDYAVDSKIKNDVATLSNFTNIDSINKLRSTKEIYNIMNIDESLLKDLFILYNSENESYKISLKDFIVFMNNNVINNKKYNISNEVSNKIKMLYNVINNLDNEMTSTNISNILEIEKSSVDGVIMYYLNTNKIDIKLTINEFTNTIINNYENYKDKFDETMYENILMLNKFSDKEFISAEISSKELSTLYGLDEQVVNNILMLTGKEKSTLIEFNEFLLNSGLITDKNTLEKLNLLKNVMSLIDNKFTYEEVSKVINIDSNTCKSIYILHNYLNSKISIKNFINTIVNNKLIDDDNINNLYNIINNLNNKYTSNEISNILKSNNSDIKLIYGLYSYNNGNNKLSLKNFINFICSNVLNNNKYNSNFNSDSRNKLLGLQRIIKNVQNNTKLSSKEMIDILSMINKNVDHSMIEIVYMYYGSNYDYDDKWTMTIEALVNYLNNDVLKDSRFDEYIKDNRRNDILNANDDINDSKDLLIGDNYSRMIITSKMSAEGEDIKLFVSNLKEELKDTDSYVIGNSPMAIEINETFDDELNLITILTMVFIFIVVALTFKSNIIPIALVLTIQCSVFTTMGILSLLGTRVYFISLLVVQAILMGATIDYAIVYTSYYLEFRKKLNVKEAMIGAYNNSIHTIITSSLILCSCTLIVALLTNAACAKICETIAEGAFCSTLLIVFILPGVLASMDKIINIKKGKENG